MQLILVCFITRTGDQSTTRVIDGGFFVFVPQLLADCVCWLENYINELREEEEAAKE